MKSKDEIIYYLVECLKHEKCPFGYTCCHECTTDETLLWVLGDSELSMKEVLEKYKMKE